MFNGNINIFSHILCSICVFNMMMLHGSFLLTGEFKINSLLDIVDEKSLQGAEKVFYHDEKTTRICRLSEEID